MLTILSSVLCRALLILFTCVSEYIDSTQILLRTLLNLSGLNLNPSIGRHYDYELCSTVQWLQLDLAFTQNCFLGERRWNFVPALCGI